MIRYSTSIAVLLLLPLLSFAQQRTSSREGAEPERAVAVVNGVNVPFSLYEMLLRDHVSYQRQAGKPEEIDQATDDQYFLQVVDNELIRQETEKRKVAVTIREATERMLQEPPDFVRQLFVDSMGTFMKEQFRQVVLDPKKIVRYVGADMSATEKETIVKQWKQDIGKVVRYVQEQMMRERLTEALYAEKPLTPSGIRARYFAEKTLVEGSFVRVLHSTIPDSSAPISPDEARAYYDANRSEFDFSAVRALSTMILPVNPLGADSALRQTLLDSARRVIEATPKEARGTLARKIQESLPPDRFPDHPVSIDQVPREYVDPLLRSRVGDVVGPFYRDDEAILLLVEAIGRTRDTILRARHIVLRVDPNDPDGEWRTRLMADSLKMRIKDDSDFVIGAQYLSQDGSAANGGDLGYFGRGRMLRAFDSAAFLGDTGQVVGPVRTPYGYHLIRVLEKRTQGYLIRELRFPLQPSAGARENAMADAQRFADALREKRPTDSLVNELRQRYPTMVFDSSEIERLQPYGDVLVTGEFAFNAKVGDVGIFTLPFNRIAVIQVTAFRPAGIPPFEKIPRYVTALAVRRKQLAMLKPIMARLADSLTPEMLIGPIREIAPLAEIFVMENKIVDPPPDEDPTILDSLIATTRAGGVGGPVLGNHAYYFLRVIARSGPTDADYQRERESFTDLYMGQYRNELLQKALIRARSRADLKDLRPSTMSLMSVRQ